jgi:hypothetical protein
MATAFFVLLGLPSRALANDAQERAAKKACMLGDVAKGMEILRA